MKPVKVVYVITGVNVGGAEKLVLDLVRSLDRTRFEPVVVAMVGGAFSPEFRDTGIRIHDLGMSRAWPFPGIARLWKIMREEKPAIVHTHLIHADFIGRVVAWSCGVPVIITTLHMVEDARRRFPYHMLDRLAARCNTSFIAVSQIVKDGIVALEKLDPAKIAVIRNAVADLPAVDPQAAQALRRGLGVAGDDILVGVVSRLEAPRKGHHVLLQALVQVVHEHPRLHCVFIGDGLGRPRLEAQARELGLEARVTFAGTQRDIPVWLRALDIFVLPSLHEGFPMAIIEAMAAGRPIIATRVGGVPELIEDGREGLLVEAGQASALGQAVDRLVRDPRSRGEFGTAARRRFEQEFEIGRAVAATQDIYRGHLREKGLCRRIRLLEVVTNLEPGGVPRHIEDLTRNLSREYFDIGLVSGEKSPGRIARLGLVHHDVAMIKPISPWQDIGSLWRLFCLFRELKPDIVHSHKSKAGCLASVAARLAGVPSVISTVHGVTRLTQGPSFRQCVYDAVEFVALRFFAHGTISVSGATAAHLARSGKVPSSRNITIHNGIAPYTGAADRARVRQRLNIGASQPVVLMTGRLEAAKRPEVLVRACALLRGEFPGLVCLVAGGGSRFEEVRALVRAQQAEGVVRLLGHRHDVPELLRASDVFALCSWSEGLSIAVLEAMAAGLPVVASRVPGMEEVVVDGATGYLVEGGSPEACASALRSLLAAPEKALAMGQAGYNKYLEEFSLERQMARTQAFLLACAGKAPRATIAEGSPC